MVMLRATDYNSANLDRGVAPKIRTLIASRHGALRRAGAFAVTLACCGLVAAAWERSEHRPRHIGHPAGAKAVAERVASAQHAIANFQQFAANALVLPLIDDTQPLRWTRSGIHWICEGRGKVAIDGEPLIEGAPIPTGRFSVRWDLHRCAPFAGGELLVDGEVELDVTHNGADFHGHIASSSLSLETPAGRFHLPVSSADDRVATGSAAQLAR